jgi:hypothetical protein
MMEGGSSLHLLPAASKLELTEEGQITKKWNPGIYVRVQGARSSFDMALHKQAADEIAGMPNVKGMKIHIYWGQLEGATPGNYTFDDVWEIYNYLKARGKRLAVHIQTREFKARTDAIVPEYLQPSSKTAQPTPSTTASGQPAGASINSAGTTAVALLWRDYVMDRYIALITALGQAFDNESHFEAIMATETAVSAPYPEWTNYSSEYLVDQIERLCIASTTSIPKTNLAVYFNYLSYDGTNARAIRLYNALYNNKVAAGGPDTYPQVPSAAEGDVKASTLGVKIRRGEIGGFDYRTSGGQYNHPAIFDTQPPQMGGKTGNWTPAELVNDAWNGTICSHLFVTIKDYQADPVTSEPDCANWSPPSGSFAACQIGFKQYINSGAANPPALNQQYPLSYGS